MKQHCKFLFTSLLLVTLSLTSWAQVNTDKVMKALRHRDLNNRLVCVHRGYRPGYVPENSAKSILLAYQAGFNMIELDVRSTADGVPILMHDETVGRMVEGFNTSNNNPGVHTRYWNDLRWRKLRSANGSILEGETVQSFSGVLDYIRNSAIAMVVVLDLKDVATAKRCWEIVKSKSNAWNTPAYRWVIFKMSPYLFKSVWDLETQFGLASLVACENGCYNVWYERFKFIPAYSTGMHFNSPSPIESYHSLRWKPYFAAIEIGIKQYNRRLQNLRDDVIRTSNDGIVAFQPCAEVGYDRYYRRDGSCCGHLSDYYAQGDLRDTQDDRPSQNFLETLTVTCIITDNSNIAANWYKGRGLWHPEWQRARVSSEDLATEAIEGIQAYPNPTAGALTISLDVETEGSAELDLFDSQGKQVLVQRETLRKGHNEVLLRNLKDRGALPGLYFLQATTPDQRRKTIKILVE